MKCGDFDQIRYLYLVRYVQSFSEVINPKWLEFKKYLSTNKNKLKIQ